MFGRVGRRTPSASTASRSRDPCVTVLSRSCTVWPFSVPHLSTTCFSQLVAVTVLQRESILIKTERDKSRNAPGFSLM
ncbi:hypothetical protein M501DRAFT_996403 [Patellaria atrata CBS 101060]|uniref:Uncharacterized protein n=1 Tax=Patellaria atrata CBS 101060 TaxID=1346257 RepID=A0A9P4S5V8_9PEZI|nr:hypothetical protein M501DRAFT_996403 [Patellaria atrata CBS 101060]